VVDNRGGGGGTIGSKQVALAPPDGYTLVVSGIGSHVIAPVENKAFNPMTEFTHIAMLGGPPTVLVVNPSMPAKNLKDFVAQVKTSKEGLSWGSPGQGTHGHLIGELFAQATKLNQTHISYKGAGPAVADLLGSQIPAAFVTLTSANAHMKAGKIKALAVTSEKRLPDYPDVPTFAELGYPSLTATTWFALSGPPNMPAALVEKINAEVRRGLKTEVLQKQLALEGIVSQDWDAANFTRYVKSENDRWVPLVRSLDKPKQ
jgi:tripartite-type tricarboxylate transporter receptor subunit TctC